MDTKLTSDEIRVLRALDPDRSETGQSFRHADIPKRLFAFHLVARQPSGVAVLTKDGQRALFRHECVEELKRLARGEVVQLSSGVERWLAASGFMANRDPGRGAKITPRGTLWLSSLEPEAETEAPLQSAEQFALQRAAAF